jgi:hypothetical protein
MMIDSNLTDLKDTKIKDFFQSNDTYNYGWVIEVFTTLAKNTVLLIRYILTGATVISIRHYYLYFSYIIKNSFYEDKKIRITGVNRV